MMSLDTTFFSLPTSKGYREYVSLRKRTFHFRLGYRSSQESEEIKSIVNWNSVFNGLSVVLQ